MLFVRHLQYVFKSFYFVVFYIFKVNISTLKYSKI